jgi:1-hydroxycarotenoid 3,4-desaturase
MKATQRAPTVVIGAGFGGLAAAVELASRGEPVVVVERELVPGGKARTINVGGRAVDVGPTVLTMRWVFDAMFAAAGRRLDDSVTLTPASVIARHAWGDGTVLDLFSDLERSVAAITAFAGGGEAAAYRRFAAQGEATAALVRGPFLEAERPSIAALIGNGARLGLRSLARVDAHRTMWRSLSSTFADPRLRALFARYATYVGSSPFEAPATLNLIAHVEREGVSVVTGGMAQLAYAVAELAKDLGVTFRLGSRVREVLTTGGRASGVVLEGLGGEREVIEASAVIANADISTLASGALGDAARGAVSVSRGNRRSLSAVTWAIVGRTEGFSLAHHNVFFSDDYAAEHDALFGQRRLATDATVYVCAQDRAAHDEAAPTGDERLFVIVNAPATADSAPLTSEEVERCERAMFSRLSRAGLRITPRAMVVTTPTSFERLAPGTGGAIYGEASHGPFSALSRPCSRTKLPGLFLAGGSVHPGPGVPMAALSGRTAARAVLRDLASMRRTLPGVMVGSTSME